MKTKTKMIAMVQIAIVLCSLFLVALPPIAADQNTQKVSATEITTASEDDYVLGIYGNANEDDTIDMGDVVYTKLAIFGKKPKTELCDAKYDGRINVLDVIQTKLIILGKEKEITVVDSVDRIVTVKKPVKRIIPFSSYITEVLRSLKAKDKIIGVPSVVTSKKVFFAEFCDLPCVGSPQSPDYEKIVELQPDVFFVYVFGYDKVADKVESLVPDVTVVRMSCRAEGCRPDVYIDYVRKLGYILNRKDEAEKLIDWNDGYMNMIKSRTERLSEDEKPRVFYTYPRYFPGTYYTVNRLHVIHEAIVSAGGINIAADIGIGGAGFPTIDPEWVIEPDPEIILGASSSCYEISATEAELEAEIDKIMSQPGWGHIDAVKNGEVYLFANRLIHSTHHPIGTAYLAKLFHPKLFEDIDPEAIHQEYLDRFQHIDFNVYEHGVWVYPPLED